MDDTLSTGDKRGLLRLAREALEAAVQGDDPPPVDRNALPAALMRQASCFVTLTIDGRLRGCIGGLAAERPLYEDVQLRAAQAGLRDYRFSPVRPDELAGIEIEVSVLTTPERLAYATPDELAARLRPGVDGVVLQQGGRKATFLPQVWEHAPEPERFLGMLCEKLGLSAEAWRKLPLEALTYQVIIMTEAELDLSPTRDDPPLSPTR
jgi:AmmeMemoRadiSam system protein A